jgi:hypothetical protein
MLAQAMAVARRRQDRRNGPPGNAPASMPPTCRTRWTASPSATRSDNGLVVVPVDGIEPCQVVVATRADDHNPLVAHFVESATNLLVRPSQ